VDQVWCYTRYVRDLYIAAGVPDSKLRILPLGIDPALHRAGVTEALRILSEHGVTTLYDGGNLEYEDEVYGLLSELDNSGKLPLRIEGTYMIFSPERRHLAVREMKRLRSAYGGQRLHFGTIKLMMDGINSTRAAGMIAPYADQPGYVGNTMLTASELKDFLKSFQQLSGNSPTSHLFHIMMFQQVCQDRFHFF
jgi:predicted amidohydrolase YtcJ